jgi:serine-type D-Ala-D-Ala carboxypeptidase/endopeptidase (penicillin-binding protein 4)
MKNYLLLVLILAVLFAACSTSRQISRMAKTGMLGNEASIAAHTGISIYEPATQKHWYDYQGDKYFIPASNTKLLTCYAAMKYLGDSLVGLLYHQSNDTLFISATGDPTFLHPDFANQRTYGLLKSTGKIISLNTSSWQATRWGSGWAWDDYNNDYMAERSAFPIYGNVATFGNQLQCCQVSPSYFSSKIARGVMQRWIDSTASVQREISSNIFFMKGADSFHSIVQIPFYTENDSVVLQLLEDTLHKTVYKNYLPGKTEASDEKEFRSQSTDSLLKLMMYRSDNFFAEQTLLMVATKILRVMNDEKIIDTLLKTDFKDLPQKPGWVDRSRLSRYNLVTPGDFIAILDRMKNQFGMERIKNILPTGGKGTLSNYYLDGGNYIFAKTGTLSGVIALSGFLYTKKNKLLIFSVMVNNHQSSPGSIRRAVEKFIEQVRNRY